MFLGLVLRACLGRSSATFTQQSIYPNPAVIDFLTAPHTTASAMPFFNLSYFRIWWFPKIRGTYFGGPYNKDYSTLGSILGSHCFGKVPYITKDEGYIRVCLVPSSVSLCIQLV